MPFTFSHPAIVLPLTYAPRRWYSLTALVVGSIVPDFEYFLRMRVNSIHSHTMSGLFYFDLPVGLVLCFLFHGIVRDQLINNLPVALKGRFIVFTQLSWIGEFKRRWLVIFTSLFVGAVSHILWDDFTHNNGYFVSALPLLQSHVLMNLPLFKLLQHLSSLIGGIVIGMAISRMPYQTVLVSKNIVGYWMKIILMAMVAMSLRFLIDHARINIGDIIVSFIGSILLAMILIGAIIMSGAAK